MKLSAILPVFLALSGITAAGPIPERLQPRDPIAKTPDGDLIDGRKAQLCVKPRNFYSMIAVAYKTRFAYHLQIQGRGWDYAGIKQPFLKCGSPYHSRWKHWKVERKDWSDLWDWQVTAELHTGEVDADPACFKRAIIAAGGPPNDAGLIMGTCW